MAAAACLGASLAIAVVMPRSRKSIVVLAPCVAALAKSTLLAAWTAVQLGATSPLTKKASSRFSSRMANLSPSEKTFCFMM
jgi:hypothetical protein